MAAPIEVPPTPEPASVDAILRETPGFRAAIDGYNAAANAAFDEAKAQGGGWIDQFYYRTSELANSMESWVDRHRAPAHAATAQLRALHERAVERLGGDPSTARVALKEPLQAALREAWGQRWDHFSTHRKIYGNDYHLRASVSFKFDDQERFATVWGMSYDARSHNGTYWNRTKLEALGEPTAEPTWVGSYNRY